MKIHMLKSLVPFFLLCGTAKANIASLAFGRDSTLPKDTKDKMMIASDGINQRRYLSDEETFPTASEVMIKNLDCSACMEAYHAESPGQRGRFRNRDLATTDEVFVTALNCDAGNPLQIWNLTALDEAGTWNLFENVETESCMQLVGECSFDGRLYTIEMGECDASNPKAIWGVTGIGQIVNFDCFVNVYNTHSTPDVFLEAQCGTDGGRDKLDISSLSSGSEDTAANFWAVFPKVLLSPEDECSECGTCEVARSNETGCSCDICESIVCDADPWCCNNNWDELCVSAAYDLCDSCSLPVCSECGTCDIERTNEVGCSCEVCEKTVCSIDSWCCDVNWDFICVGLAFENCDICLPPETSPPETSPPETSPPETSPPVEECSECGTCDVERTDEVGCSCEACEAAVCDFDSWCCDVNWDSTCVNVAHDFCDSCSLGNDVCSACGNCDFGRPEGGCSCEVCETIVCQIDDYCCNVEWDSFCVESAYANCESCAT